ncbi:MAG: hypothetical protein ABFD50_18850 [Smithella sp.]
MKKPRWYQNKDTYNAESQRVANMEVAFTSRENAHISHNQQAPAIAKAPDGDEKMARPVARFEDEQG